MITYDELIKNLNVLLVDDDEDFIDIAYFFLLSKGFKVDVVKNGKDAIEIINEKKHQIILLDYFMPDLSGEDVLNEIRKTNKEVVVIMQTGFSGQKPPIETMQRLNIQNYHDKTEGLDKLYLELISAVKILSQQNEIYISKYKSNAIGKLVNNIALDIKGNLMSLGAGLEVTNMIINSSQVDQDAKDKLSSFYSNNKHTLEKIDKILTAIINQSTDNSEEVLTEEQIIEDVNLILDSELKVSKVKLDTKTRLRAKSYISGNVNDLVFLVCEIISKIVCISNENDEIELILTEDEANWYFKMESSNISNFSVNELFLLKNIVLSLKNCNLTYSDKDITISLKKQ